MFFVLVVLGWGGGGEGASRAAETPSLSRLHCGDPPHACCNIVRILRITGGLFHPEKSAILKNISKKTQKFEFAYDFLEILTFFCKFLRFLQIIIIFCKFCEFLLSVVNLKNRKNLQKIIKNCKKILNICQCLTFHLQTSIFYLKM